MNQTSPLLPPGCVARWRLRYRQDLFEEAVRAVDGASDDEGGLLSPSAVKPSPLHGLAHTARSGSYREVRAFISRRAERRRKSSDRGDRGAGAEADFWEAALRLLQKAIDRETPRLLEACGGDLADTSAQKRVEDEAKAVIARLFLEPLVTHCLFTLSISERTT